MIYYTGDPHFGHANIIIYTGRPFIKYGDIIIEGKWSNLIIKAERCKWMDETLINNINQRIKESDTLIIDGDFCFSKSTEASDAPKKAYDYYRDKIKCKNIINVAGNHDNNNSTKTALQKLIIKQGGKKICIVHNPEFADLRYEINLTAHVHHLWQIKRIRKNMDFTDCINIGVDVWNFYPVTWNEIWQRYSKWLKEGKYE